ncbi:MAG: hypothetical protein IPL61_38875 [Myxococcales bacterium]|nr:hypothetical protein [Myxococcales bacterium]
MAALALAAVATLALTPGTAPWPTLAAPAIAAPAAPTIASQPWVVADTDDYTLRASWTDGARAGDRLKVQVEIWDDAGAALPLAGLAGALRDPDGHSVGVTGAALRALELPLAGVGDYVLTVFAPDGDVTLAVTIPVGPPPQS